MPGCSKCEWLEAMLDRAIASYEAHRGALQMISTELCRASYKDDSVHIPSEDRRRLLAVIDKVLHHHALRFSPASDTTLKEEDNVTYREYRHQSYEQSHASTEANTSVRYEPQYPPSAPPPVQRTPLRRVEDDTQISEETLPEDSRSSAPNSGRRTGVRLTNWPVPEQQQDPPTGPTLAEQFRSRRSTNSRSNSRHESRVEASSTEAGHSSAHAPSPRTGRRHADPERADRRQTSPPSLVQTEKDSSLTSPQGRNRPRRRSLTERDVKDWQRVYTRDGWDGERRRDGVDNAGEEFIPVDQREKVQERPLRTPVPRRGTGKPTDSREIEQALFTGGLKSQFQHPDVVGNSEAARRYMEKEDAQLNQRKLESIRALAEMNIRPMDQRKVETPTAIEAQLQKEQLALESQLRRMEQERDFMLRKNPSDNGSEARYTQLNHRIGRVTEDLKRVDRELRTVRELERRGDGVEASR